MRIWQCSAEYYEKNRDLKERLTEFRAEIEGLKKEDRLSDHDKIHATNVQFGIDKYSSLRKVRLGLRRSSTSVLDLQCQVRFQLQSAGDIPRWLKTKAGFLGCA